MSELEKCPRCGKKTLKVLRMSSDIYGWLDNAKCTNCDYKCHEGGPPRWFVEESRPTSGPGSRAPYGMGVRDEHGAL